jgi:carboxylesterase type B
MVGGARRFLKIPYAKPPLGELRWKAPVKNDPWTGERFETEIVENCPQLQDQGSPASNNEDCLYLKMWSPEPAPERAPVMVWIHGGGNFSGGAGIPIPVTDRLWFDGDYDAARARVVGDSGVVCSTHDTARRAVKAGLKVFMYNFNVWWSLSPETFRAGHAAEISDVFGSPYVREGQDPSVTEESQMVADAMNTYWARFAETGDPNGPDAPAQWPEFDPDDDQRLQLDPSWEVFKDFRKVECEFWREYYGVD